MPSRASIVSPCSPTVRVPLNVRNLCGLRGTSKKAVFTIDLVSRLSFQLVGIGDVSPGSSTHVVKRCRAESGLVRAPDDEWMRQFILTAPTVSSSSNSLRNDWRVLAIAHFDELVCVYEGHPTYGGSHTVGRTLCKCGSAFLCIVPCYRNTGRRVRSGGCHSLRSWTGEAWSDRPMM